MEGALRLGYCELKVTHGDLVGDLVGDQLRIIYRVGRKGCCSEGGTSPPSSTSFPPRCPCVLELSPS